MTFPLRFFRNSLSFVRIFKEKSSYRWGQLIVLWGLMTAIIMCPMAYILARHPNLALEDFQARAIQLVNQETVTRLQQLTVDEKGLLSIEKEERIDQGKKGQVIFTPSLQEKSLKDDRPVLVIAKSAFLLKEPDRPLTKVTYLTDNQLTKSQNVKAVRNELSRMWLETNRVSLLMARLLTVWVLIFVNVGLMLLGAGSLLSLMRFYPAFDLKTVKEGVGLVSQAFFLPSLLAMCIGFLTENPSLILITVTSGLILVLLAVFWKTHFNYGYISKEKKDRNRKV
ncbi:hypothetical protein D3H64_00110 [Atopobacter sp. AH10]|uniref:hypothetical protein n=1 Tax=Atopobacter sp. AH10 TaxID=2315861 RepID=UPI000EF17BE0|nr:hypothetical protein [Atopobacter sp. AH10]RLK64217.1 hypothetical protein D3H64_00110 [Atopobacter sp. AH10]